MQLMALNALLLFDAIFIFFLFLVSVSCLLYYLPLVPPSRSSSRDGNNEEDADLESALVESGVDLESETPHYCHHHYIRESEISREMSREISRGRQSRHHHLEEDDEARAELELQLLHVSSCGGAHYHQVANHDDHDHEMETEVSDLCQTSKEEGGDRNHFSPTHSNLNQQQQPQQDHPATHIIMTPPQRKYQNKGRDKGQPFARVETVSGTVGLVSLYFILTGLTQEMNQLQRAERPSSKTEQKLDDLAERYWVILLSFAFPMAVTFLVGVAVILSAVKNSEYLLLISVVMSGILIIAVLSISVILFVLSFKSAFIAPHWIWGLVQVYFTLVLLTYRNDIVHYKPEIHEDNDYDDD